MRALVAYFGETRAERCNHCSHCLNGRPQRLPEPDPKPSIETVVDAKSLAEIRAANPGALGMPRQAARFLAGITSPAGTRAKLTRHPLFGALADRRFLDIMAWCDALTVTRCAHGVVVRQPLWCMNRIV